MVEQRLEEPRVPSSSLGGATITILTIMTKKRLIILFIVVLSVSGILLTGKIVADRQAGAFTRAALAQQEQRDRIKQLGQDFTYSDKIILGRTETDKELATLKAQCTKLDQISAAAELMAKPPALATNWAGFLSSNYKTAQNRVVPTTGTGTLATQAAKLFQACNSYVLAVTVFQENTKFTEQKAALLSNDCGGIATCLPLANFAAYKQYFQEDRTLNKQAAEALAERCAFEELQTLCDLQLDYRQKRIVLDDAYNAALDTNNVTAASNAYGTNPYPEEQVCVEARRVAKDDSIREDCSTLVGKALAGQYEARIKAEIEKL